MRVATLIVLASLLAAPARGDTCPAIAQGGAFLASEDAGARLEFIRRALEADSAKALSWRTGWLVVLPIVDAAELSLAISGTVAPNPPVRPQYNFDWALLTLLRQGRYGLYAGSITAAGGIGSVLLRSRYNAFDGARLDGMLTGGPPADICALLAEAERLLLRDARDEAVGHSALPHLVSGAASVATLLIVGLVFHRWASAAFNAGLGLIGGELLIASEPRDAERALKQYRLGDLTLHDSPLMNLEISGSTLALHF